MVLNPNIFVPVPPFAYTSLCNPLLRVSIFDREVMMSLWDEAFGLRMHKASEGVIMAQGPGFVQGLRFRMV